MQRYPARGDWSKTCGAEPRLKTKKTQCYVKVMTMMAALSMIVLKCIFDCFNVRIRTSNKHSFSRAWDGGCNGIQHVVVGAVLATQISVWRPRNTGFPVVVLECIFDCFNVRFRTSNQDTFWRAWDGGCNGTQHMAIRAELAAQGSIERTDGFMLWQGYKSSQECVNFGQSEVD